MKEQRKKMELEISDLTAKQLTKLNEISEKFTNVKLNQFEKAKR